MEWFFKDRILTVDQKAELEANIIKWKTWEVKIAQAKFEIHLSDELRNNTYHECKYSLCEEYENLNNLRRSY